MIDQSQIVDPGPVPGPAVHRRMRWPAVVTTLLVVVAATACANNTPNASPPPTFVANSPWLGSFAAVAVPAPVNTISGLDCVSASMCWAVGSAVEGPVAPMPRR